VRFRPFSDADIARIRPTTNPLVTIANPFDYHTFDWAKRERLTATFTEVLNGKFDLGMLVIDLPHAEKCDAADWHVGIDAFADAATAAGARAATLSTLAECMPEATARALIARGVAPLIGMEETLAAVAAAAVAGRPLTQAAPFRPLASGPAPSNAKALDEAESKRRLAAAGVPIPRGQLVRTTQKARAAFQQLTQGGPAGGTVVAKACSDTLLHKTEAGGVRLGLRTGADVEAAFAELVRLAPAVLVEEMIGDAVAELIIGVTRDPQFGPVLTIGSGGILVELIADVATLLLPTTPEKVAAALDSLKVARLIAGYRGRPAGDRGAAIAAILAVARFAEAHATTLSELDVNPLLIRPEGRGAVAVDALIRMA
jgi:acetate---CoA ligase (ADP-forming)